MENKSYSVSVIEIWFLGVLHAIQEQYSETVEIYREISSNLVAFEDLI